MKEVSLYIHIPFCKQKCFYCDFPSFAGKEQYREEYIEALVKEIEQRCSDYIIKTIFIGGGTPSYLEVHEIQKLLVSINKLHLSHDIEFSMECNPGVLFEEKLIAMKEGGVNRISFGLQSCDDNLLKSIGRIHSYSDFVQNFELARKIGFENINVDLMYGLPNLKFDKWKETLQTICELRPEHISAYSLIIEEGTAFYKLYEKDLLELPTEDEEREMDSITKEVLSNYGYNQYEISNYSLKGKECRHNIVYWQLKDYIGVGTAASSYINGIRISNTEDIKEYIEKINKGEDVAVEEHKNSKEDEIEEYIFMGLRMKEGVNLNNFKERFGLGIESIYIKIIEKNINKGLLNINDDRMYLTTKGIELSNSVMSDFILDK